jgi:hypothetical protein
VTVCRLSPHSHLGLVTPSTLRLKRKSLSPIFSVRNCTSSALSRLLRPSCNWSTFLVDRGVCLYVALPLVSVLHLAVHARSACVLHHLLSVDLSGYSFGGVATGGHLRPFSLHPVASLAAVSAASFPGIPTWAGIHRTVTGRPISWSRWTWLSISSRI